MLGKIEGGRRRGWQRMRWLDGITYSVDMSLNNLWKLVMGQGSLVCSSPWGCKELDTTEWKVVFEHAKTPGFLVSRGGEFNPGPETRLDCSELLCNKVLLKYKGDRSVWSRLCFFQWSCMDVRVALWRKLSAKKLMLLNCGVGEDSWESLGLQGDPTSPS